MAFSFDNPSKIIDIYQGPRDDCLSVFMGLRVFEEHFPEDEYKALRDMVNAYMDSDEPYFFNNKPSDRLFITRTPSDMIICSGFQNQFIETRDGILIFFPNIYDFLKEPIGKIIEHFVERGCAVYRQRPNIAESVFYKNKARWNLDLLPLEPFRIKIYEDMGFSVIFATDHPFDVSVHLPENRARFERETRYISNICFKLNEMPAGFYNEIKNIYMRDKKNTALMEEKKRRGDTVLLKGTQNMMFPVWTRPTEPVSEISLPAIYDSRVLARLRILYENDANAIYDGLINIAEENPEVEAKMPIPDEWKFDFQIQDILKQKAVLLAHEDYVTRDLKMLQNPQPPINPRDGRADHRLKQANKMRERMERERQGVA